MLTAQDGSEVVKISDEIKENGQEVVFEVEIKNDDIDLLDFQKTLRQVEYITLVLRKLTNGIAK